MSSRLASVVAPHRQRYQSSQAILDYFGSRVSNITTRHKAIRMDGCWLNAPTGITEEGSRLLDFLTETRDLCNSPDVPSQVRDDVFKTVADAVSPDGQADQSSVAIVITKR